MNLNLGTKSTASPPIPGNLQAYNRLVLQLQDEVYSLAFYLLGDENQADRVVEEAFRERFGKRNGDPSKFRLELLRLIIHNSLKRVPTLPCTGIFGPDAAQLTIEAKLVCILVDCLELSYQEAALVLDRPLASIRKILAETRFKMITGSRGEK